MKEWQKIIKYLAIAFGIYLSVTIIGTIVGVIGMIGTGIFAKDIILSNVSSDNVDFTKTYTDVKNLDIDVASCDFYLLKGDEFKIEASNIDSSCKIELDNGTLKINEKKVKLFKNNTPKIVIYIPNGEILENVKINLGVSKSNISNLNCNNLKIDFGAGKVDMQSVNSNRTDLDCGAGKVEITDSLFKDLDLDCGVGKFTFDGQITGKSNIECGVGKVELDLEGGKDIYELTTESGLGAVTIDGTKISGKQTTGNGENKLNISGGLGAIDINM